MKYKRILLKLSGESLMGEQGYGIDVKRVESYARQIKAVAEQGVQIGIRLLLQVLAVLLLFRLR